MVTGIFFQISRAESKILNIYTPGTQRKNNCFRVDRFCDHSSAVFERLGCFHLFFECQELQYELTEEDIVKGHGRKGMDELRQFIWGNESFLSLKYGSSNEN